MPDFPLIPNPQPNIGGGGIIQDPGFGGTLATGLAGVLSAMKQRQELDQAKQEFEQKKLYYASQTEGTQLDNTKKKADIKKQTDELAGQELGLQGFNEYIGGGQDDKKLGELVTSPRYKNNPYAVQNLLERVHSFREDKRLAAETRKAESQANVQETTAPAQISATQDAATSAGVAARVATKTEGTQVADARNAAALHKAQADAAAAEAAQLANGANRPENVNAMTQLYRGGGVTLGDAAKTTGVTLPPGTDLNQKFEVQTRGMAIRKAEQKAAATQSLLAHGANEELIAKGVRITKLTPIKDMVPADMARSTIPGPEQQLMAAGRQFTSQYILSISGKAATDKERDDAWKQIAPRSGDSEPLKNQKRIMREAIVQIMNDASHGATRPTSEIIESTVGALRSKGVPEPALQFLKDSKKKALIFEQELKKADATEKATGEVGSPGTVSADPAMTTADSASAFLSTFGRGN